MFTCPQKDGLKVDAIKSCFGAHKFDYLGYHVTRDEVMPIPKKVEAVQALTVPKTRKQLGLFIVMINFYRDMWQKRSELLAPLTDLTSKMSNTTGKTSNNFFWCYQTCDRTWSIVGVPVLQWSVWNTYWCFQATNWRSALCSSTELGKCDDVVRGTSSGYYDT